MKAHEILNQAQTEMQDRAKTYDKPAGERSMGACINAFEAITKVKLTVEQGWLFMCLLKAVRSQQGDYRADNYVDLAAYAGLMGEAASDPDYRDRRRLSDTDVQAERDGDDEIGSLLYRKKRGSKIMNQFSVRGFPTSNLDHTPEEDEAWSRRESQIFEDAWNEAKNQEFAEQWDEKRIDVIGQNGPTGDHYREPPELTLYIYNGHRIVGQAHNVGRCSNCGEVWICGEKIETTCPGKPCDHTAGLHSYSSTKEAQCIDCKEMLMGGDDAKLTQHKRKSGVGPDT